MSQIWMQFTDSAMTGVTGWSWWEQPLETWPYQAEVETSDPRYVAYYDSSPDWMKPWMPTPTTSS
ncbi:hypothetical protein PQR57_17150 [Paraburkholderia dipogonis]|uniref:Uncharacterized protein n=1 Tax=Paraburkholderia dipogonis TaxID=1211383 RepID=A0ABW9ART9_9BURK